MVRHGSATAGLEELQKQFFEALGVMPTEQILGFQRVLRRQVDNHWITTGYNTEKTRGNHGLERLDMCSKSVVGLKSHAIQRCHKCFIQFAMATMSQGEIASS